MDEKQLLKHCPFCGGALTYSENTLCCHNNQCGGVFKRNRCGLPYWKTAVGIQKHFLNPHEGEREKYCYYRGREEMLAEIRNKILKSFHDPDVLICGYDEQESIKRNGCGVIVSIQAEIKFQARDYSKPIT